MVKNKRTLRNACFIKNDKKNVKNVSTPMIFMHDYI